LQITPCDAEPTLYLHIGRNKAGSTTLQNYILRHLAQLGEAGVRYAMFGQPSPATTSVPTFPTHRHIAAFVRAQRGGAVLVSHEGLCCFTPELTQIMATDLAGLDIQLLFYIRPYREWVVSSYSFDVRTGHNALDFDRYLERIRPAISFWPILEIWGQTLGWHRVRVRSLAQADLIGGDLVRDFTSAIGLPPAPPDEAARANSSPGWVVIELLRMIAPGGPATGWTPATLPIAQLLHHLADQSMAALGVQQAQGNYLSAAQSDELAALYNNDLDFVAARTGVHLQADAAGQAPERDFLPSVECIPKTILRMIRERALAPAFAAIHPQAAAFVSSDTFSRLCGAL
jgi:hypothetical protein